MLKKIAFLFTFCVVCIYSIITVNATTVDQYPTYDQYTIVNSDDLNSPIYQSDVYSRAYQYYTQNYDPNWIIMKGNKVVTANAAIGYLDQTDCVTNVEFIYEENDESGYTNGCYGVDTMYISTNSSATYALVMISGAKAWVPMNLITLVPLETLEYSTSFYRVNNGELIHYIQTSRSSSTYGNAITLDKAPVYLQEGINYYSYDGHYFYDDLALLSQDLKNNSFSNSINSTDPYYNPYQYLSHRSTSSVSAQQLNDYFKELGMNQLMQSYQDINGDSIDDRLNYSQFYQSGNQFISAQNLYNSNALMMSALSLNESGYGRSRLAFTRNNLFGHAAYDSSVEASASRYLSPLNSIISHAKNYIDNQYCNPNNFVYHGCFFGSKESGMNVSYASDPYWGEKAASYLYDLDKRIGLNEVSSYHSIIVNPSTSIYSDSSLSKELMQLTSIGPSSLIVVNQLPNAYEVILDHTIETEDAQITHGYISINDVIVDLNPEGNYESNEVFIHLDANGGQFFDGTSELSFNGINDVDGFISPNKQGYQFKEYTLVNNDETSYHYQAQYDETVSLRLVSMPKIVFELNETIDLSNGIVELTYKDGSSIQVSLSSDMVSGFSMANPGIQRVTITYGGQTCSYIIYVSEELDAQYQTIKDTINATLEYGSATQEQIESFKQTLDSSQSSLPRYTMNQYIQLDTILSSIFDTHDYAFSLLGDVDYSISNIFLAFNLNQYPHQALIQDLFNVSLNTMTLDMDTSLFDRLGYQIVSTYDLSIMFNKSTPVDLDAPLIYTITKPENSSNSQYMVFLENQQGITQCWTTQGPNTISFATDSTGKIILAKKDVLTVSQNSSDYNGTITKDKSYKDVYNASDLLMKVAIASSAVVITLIWLAIVLIMLNKARKKK